MSIIIRLQNLPWSANAADIRQFFRSLSIPEGGVHIIGGDNGDAFIAFSSDEDARQAMLLDGGKINDVPIKLLLSSKSEMQKIIENARQQALNLQNFVQMAGASFAPTASMHLPILPAMLSSLIQQGTSPASILPQLKAALPTTTPLPPSITSNAAAQIIQKTIEIKDDGKRNNRSNDSRSRSRSRDGRSHRSSRNDKSRDGRRRRDRSRSDDRSNDEWDSRSRSRDRHRRRSRDRRDNDRDKDSRQSKDSRRRDDRNTSSKSAIDRSSKRSRFESDDKIDYQKTSDKTLPEVSRFNRDVEANNAAGKQWRSWASSGVKEEERSGNIGRMTKSTADNGSGATLGGKGGGQFLDDRNTSKFGKDVLQERFQTLQTSLSSKDSFTFPPRTFFSDTNENRLSSETTGAKFSSVGRNLNAEYRTGFPKNENSFNERPTRAGNDYTSNENFVRKQLPSLLTLNRLPLVSDNKLNDQRGGGYGGNSRSNYYQNKSGDEDNKRHLDNDEYENSYKRKNVERDFRNEENSESKFRNREFSRSEGGGVGGGYNNQFRNNRFNSRNDESSSSNDSRTRRLTTEPACVELRNMPLNASGNDIRRFFEEFQLVGSCIKFINDSKGNRTGIAYVRLSSTHQQREALKLNGKLIRNSPTEVIPLNNDIFDSAPECIRPSQNDEYLKVCDIPIIATEKDVLEMFPEVTPPEITMLKNKEQQTFTAFLKFENNIVARRALTTKSKFFVCGKEVNLEEGREDEFNNAKKISKFREENERENGKGKVESKGENETKDEDKDDKKLAKPHSEKDTCVKISGFLPSVTDRDVTELLADICVVPERICYDLDKEGNRTGDVYCEFVSNEDVVVSLTKEGIKIDGNVISVKSLSRLEMKNIVFAQRDYNRPSSFSRLEYNSRHPRMGMYNRPQRYPGPPRGMVNSKMRYPYSGMNQGYGGGGGPPRHCPPGLEAFRKPGCIIGLENVPYAASVEEILDFFDGYGVSKDDVIRRYDEVGRPTGDARVKLQNSMLVQKALNELQNRKIRNRIVTLQPV